MSLNVDIDSALAKRTPGILNYIAMRAEMAREAALAEERARAAIPVDKHYDSIGEALTAINPSREDVSALQDKINKLNPDQPEIPVTGTLDPRTVAEFERYVAGASKSDGVDYADSLKTQSKQTAAMLNLSVRMDADIEQLISARNQNLFVDSTPHIEPEAAVIEAVAAEETPAPPSAEPEPAIVEAAVTEAVAIEETPPAPPAPPAPPTPEELGVDAKTYEFARQGFAALSDIEQNKLQHNARKLNAPPGMESIFALLAMVITRADLLKGSEDLWSGEQKQPVDIIREASAKINVMANGEPQQAQKSPAPIPPAPTPQPPAPAPIAPAAEIPAPAPKPIPQPSAAAKLGVSEEAYAAAKEGYEQLPESEKNKLLQDARTLGTRADDIDTVYGLIARFIDKGNLLAPNENLLWEGQ